VGVVIVRERIDFAFARLVPDPGLQQLDEVVDRLVLRRQNQHLSSRRTDPIRIVRAISRMFRR
jgi:hypothetical protein